MRGTFQTLAALCLGTSVLAAPAIAQVIDYPNGTNNTSPIVLNNSTSLQVLTGSAIQSGTISESGGSYQINKTGSGTLILSGINTYSGQTIISAGTLALSGSGSIANSSSVALNGNVFDISASTSGASVKSLFSLNGSSSVALGSKTLTITSGIPSSGSSVFFGNINGSGGITISGGSQTFTGLNTYTGQTVIASGAELTLSNSGSIATSDVVNNGSLSAQSSNATVKSLTGTGTVIGSLTVANAVGTFAGAMDGALTVAGGTQTLSGSNVLTTATINSGATLALSGPGSVASGSTFINNGTLDISAATSGISVQFLSGAGNIVLGSNTLTLVNPGGTGFTSTFSGVISGTGGVTIAGGTGGGRRQSNPCG